MKVCEILTLNESTKVDYSEHAFVHMEYSLNTFGEFMKKFPQLDDLIKEIALEHEWSGDTFAKLKQLQIPERYLHGVTVQTAIADFTKSKSPIVLAHFTSVDEEVGFQADSIFYEPIIIKIYSDKHDSDTFYVLDVNDSRSSYSEVRREGVLLNDIRSRYYSKVNFSEYVADVKLHGVEYVLDNFYKYSQISMLTVFSNEV